MILMLQGISGKGPICTRGPSIDLHQSSESKTSTILTSIHFSLINMAEKNGPSGGNSGNFILICENLFSQVGPKRSQSKGYAWPGLR